MSRAKELASWVAVGLALVAALTLVFYFSAKNLRGDYNYWTNVNCEAENLSSLVETCCTTDQYTCEPLYQYNCTVYYWILVWNWHGLKYAKTIRQTNLNFPNVCSLKKSDPETSITLSSVDENSSAWDQSSNKFVGGILLIFGILLSFCFVPIINGIYEHMCVSDKENTTHQGNTYVREEQI